MVRIKIKSHAFTSSKEAQMATAWVFMICLIQIKCHLCYVFMVK